MLIAHRYATRPNLPNLNIFFPVILRSFPVTEICFPVNVLIVFVQEMPVDVGFFAILVASLWQIFAFFPVFFPVIGDLPSETGSYLTAHTTKLFKTLAV
jgi:hypothetical protein